MSMLLGVACVGPELGLSPSERDAGSDARAAEAGTKRRDAALVPARDGEVESGKVDAATNRDASRGGAGNAGSGGAPANGGTSGAGGVEPGSGETGTGGTTVIGSDGGRDAGGGDAMSTGGTAACVTSTDCRACCDQVVTSGRSAFTRTFSGCICDFCRSSCSDLICAAAVPPTDMCFLCVVKSGRCDSLSPDCQANPDCSAWVQCISSCL
jgi:hypothetical protein